LKQIKLTGNRRPTVRHSGGGAQSGNLAQGTRNHRSASAVNCWCIGSYIRVWDGRWSKVLQLLARISRWVIWKLNVVICHAGQDDVWSSVTSAEWNDGCGVLFGRRAERRSLSSNPVSASSAMC